MTVNTQSTVTQAEIDLVEKVWGGIMEVAQAVVKKHEELGFELISQKVNPSLEDIAMSLRVVEQIFDALMPVIDDMSLNRMMLNAKQQILLIALAANAIKAKDESSYHAAIQNLRDQSQI